MNARYLLVELARVLAKHRLDAVMIGNAAAALQGAPVTTVDVDFLVRPAPVTERKLKRIAAEMEAVLFRPFYPVSGMYRLSRDTDGIQVDFMTRIHGIRSFEGLRDRGQRVEFDGSVLVLASLSDILKSKRAAARPKDLATVDVIEATLQRKEAKE